MGLGSALGTSVNPTAWGGPGSAPCCWSQSRSQASWGPGGSRGSMPKWGRAWKPPPCQHPPPPAMGPECTMRLGELCQTSRMAGSQAVLQRAAPARTAFNHWLGAPAPWMSFFIQKMGSPLASRCGDSRRLCSLLSARTPLAQMTVGGGGGGGTVRGGRGGGGAAGTHGLVAVAAPEGAEKSRSTSEDIAGLRKATLCTGSPRTKPRWA